MKKSIFSPCFFQRVRKGIHQMYPEIPLRTGVTIIPGLLPGNMKFSAPENGKSGEVPRELVNKLLMNPFDELKKVRLRAKFDNDDPLGMQVHWIAKDSLLKELGVQKGDIVRSVNGIPMTNMGDISNAINSLMGGTNFDVEVLRDGKSVPLTYVVR